MSNKLYLDISTKVKEDRGITQQGVEFPHGDTQEDQNQPLDRFFDYRALHSIYADGVNPPRNP